MSDADAQAAAAAAMAAAVRRFNIELWALYASGVLITAMRTYSRISTVGIRRLWADDYIVWLAIVGIPSGVSPIWQNSIIHINLVVDLLHAIYAGVLCRQLCPRPCKQFDDR